MRILDRLGDPSVTGGSERRDGGATTPGGLDLARLRPVAWWLRRRSSQFELILPNQILFWVVIVGGFAGATAFDENFGTAITWYVWFTLVFVLVLLSGRGWCAMCPFGGLAEWLQRRRLWHRRGAAAPARGRAVPPWLARYGYVTTAMTFGVLTWVEEYYEVSDGSSPVRTSWTVLGLIVLAVAAFLAFERRSFCRYLCPLGGLIGALGAGAPLRGFAARDAQVCRRCPTRDCLRGNDRAYGCPWFNWPGGSSSNVNCGLCGECFRACPSDNVGLFVGAPLSGLTRVHDRRADVAWTVAVLAGVMTHQHVHTSRAWQVVDDWANALTGLPHGPNPLLFVLGTALYTALLVLPVEVARRVFYRRPAGGLPDRGPSFVHRLTPFRVFFLPFAYAAIPLLGCDFLAVELLSFVGSAPKVVPAATHMLGFGAHPASFATLRLLPERGVVPLQVAVLAAGTLASAAVLWRVAGAELAPFTGRPRAIQLAGSALLLLAGAAVVTVYVLTQGEAG